VDLEIGGATEDEQLWEYLAETADDPFPRRAVLFNPTVNQF